MTGRHGHQLAFDTDLAAGSPAPTATRPSAGARAWRTCRRHAPSGRRALIVLGCGVTATATYHAVCWIIRSPHGPFAAAGAALGLLAGIWLGRISARRRADRTRELLDWVGQDLVVQRSVVQIQAHQIRRLTGERP